jgi:hypothetical protein
VKGRDKSQGLAEIEASRDGKRSCSLSFLRVKEILTYFDHDPGAGGYTTTGQSRRRSRLQPRGGDI